MTGAEVEVDVTRDVVYAPLPGGDLELDLYRPRDAQEPLPAAIYLHGGGWTFGDRRAGVEGRLLPVVRQGVAIASISYRLTDVATFPAQIHDLKAAIRWLRAHAPEFGIDPDRIGVWGASAGAHLALLAGLTAGLMDFEGDLGEHLDTNSAVSAVVSWFAPADLLAVAEHVPDPELLRPFLIGGRPMPPFEARLLGAETVREVPEQAGRASPLHWARNGATEARFLLMHGTRDGAIPVDQSELMLSALLEAGTDASLLLIAGANHEDPAFEFTAPLGAVASFLRA